MIPSQLKSALALILILSILSNAAPIDEDPTVDMILKRHADAVGTDGDEKNTANRIAIGRSEFELNLPAWRTAGKVLFASDTQNAMLISSFDLPEYPFEKIGLFGNKVEIPFITPGTRSPMGSYLLLNNNILSERLFGGAISVSWRLFDARSVLDRLKFGGRKKINGKEALVLRFNARGNASADSSVDIYIDANNYRHLGTEYRQKIADKNLYQVGVFGNQTGENSNTLTEEFDDFRTVGGLTLPFKYTIKLILDGRVGTKEFRWTFRFDEYRVGQNLGKDFFTFEKK